MGLVVWLVVGEQRHTKDKTACGVGGGVGQGKNTQQQQLLQPKKTQAGKLAWGASHEG